MCTIMLNYTLKLRPAYLSFSFFPPDHFSDPGLSEKIQAQMNMHNKWKLWIYTCFLIKKNKKKNEKMYACHDPSDSPGLFAKWVNRDKRQNGLNWTFNFLFFKYFQSTEADTIITHSLFILCITLIFSIKC